MKKQTENKMLYELKKKSPGLAGVLSFLVVGAGQIYNGEAGKGVIMFFGCIFLWLVLLGWIVNIWAIVDAYTTADKKNKILSLELKVPFE